MNVRSHYKAVVKGWGYEYWIHNSPMYCAKILEINKDKRCSMHYHEKKHETFYLISGLILLELGNQTLILHPGEIIDIMPYQLHRFTGMSEVPSQLFETSTQHFESDSIRTEKGD